MKEEISLTPTNITDPWLESFLRSRTHDYDHELTIACKEKRLRLAWGPVRQMCPHLENTEFHPDEMRMIAEFIWGVAENGVERIYGDIGIHNVREKVDASKADLLAAQHLLSIINFINNKWIMQNMTSPNHMPAQNQVTATNGEVARALA